MNTVILHSVQHQHNNTPLMADPDDYYDFVTFEFNITVCFIIYSHFVNHSGQNLKIYLKFFIRNTNGIIHNLQFRSFFSIRPASENRHPAMYLKTVKSEIKPENFREQRPHNK